MKKRLRKLLALFTASVMTAGILAGCSGGSGGGSSASTGTDAAPAPAADQAAEEAAPAATEKKASNGGKEVTVWHYFEHEAAALEQFAAEYNAMQSEINIVCTYISREELMKQYTIGAVSGELPDIGMVDSPDMASYISLGVFEDITPEMKEWADLSQFYEGPLSSCMDSDGNIYGIPNNSNCLALAYNVDMLKAAGFDNPPATWEEFEKVCEAVSKPDEGIFGYSMCAIGTEEGTFQFIPWLYGAGASVTKTSSPEAAQALDFLAGLVNKGYMSKEVVNWTQGDAYNAFCAGKAAMMESGTWQIATFDKDINGAFEYKIALLPKNGETGNYATVIGGENFGVCAGSEARDECIKFLQYMMSAEKNAEWCEIAGKLPVRGDAVALKDIWTADARYATFNDAMKYAVARGPHESWPTISQALYTAEQAALLGNKTGSEAMAEAAAKIDPILAETPIPE